MRLIAFVSLIALAASLAPAHAALTARSDRPKLVVVIVVDQMRRAEIDRLAPHLTGGFRRLLTDGARLDGHYGQQNTYTGPGHALILSGSYGYLNGIIQNKWFNRATNRTESMLYDPSAQVIGAGEVGPGEDTSPRNFLGSTVGDELRMFSDGRSRVIALAVKERAAMLLGGRSGTAYYVDEARGDWTTSTYYMPTLPAWVTAFNAQRTLDKAFGTQWTRLLPIAAYGDEPDAPAWEGGDELGYGKAFPHPLSAGETKPSKKSHEAALASPVGIELTFAFARAAIENEQLGQRAGADTDLLAISISPTDFVGHAFGPYSQEARDMFLRTDRGLGDFFTFLDGKIGKGNWIAMVTADHGSAQPPERARAAGVFAERVKKAQIKAAIGGALDARFGKGDWIVALEDPSVYLNRRLIEERKLDPGLVEETAGEALLTIPGFSGFATRTNLMRGQVPPTNAGRAMARSFYPARAGDVIAMQAPFSFWGKYGEAPIGSTHGSFYRYDTDVMAFFLGAPFVPGYHGQIEQVDLAATLARFLGVNLPAACEGQPLYDVVRAWQTPATTTHLRKRTD